LEKKNSFFFSVEGRKISCTSSHFKVDTVILKEQYQTVTQPMQVLRMGCVRYTRNLAAYLFEMLRYQS